MAKTRKNKKRLRGGKKYKELWCSQSIVNIPRMECFKKKCGFKAGFKDKKSKKLHKLNKQYDKFLDKECGLFKLEHDKWEDCAQRNRDGNKLFEQIRKLEHEQSVCENKCKSHSDIMDDCMELGEQQCRIKYKDLISKQKRKIIPIEKCL